MSRFVPDASVPGHQCFGSTGKIAEDVRQLAIARLVEGEGHLALAGLLRPDDIGITPGVERLCAFSVSKVQMTSSTAIGWPSCQRAAGLRRNFAQAKSAG